MKESGRFIPNVALSVRQPWAWAIFHGKDIENRSWKSNNPAYPFRGRTCIHAAQGMTRDEYEGAADFMAHIGVECPAPADLLRGGIIGTVTVLDIVKDSRSPWFAGPRGLVLLEPTETEFIPAAGALGYFQWKRNDDVIVEPAKWMREWGQPKAAAPVQIAIELPHLSPLERMYAKGRK